MNAIQEQLYRGSNSLFQIGKYTNAIQEHRQRESNSFQVSKYTNAIQEQLYKEGNSFLFWYVNIQMLFNNNYIGEATLQMFLSK